MTTISDQVIYDKCKERIQQEVNSTLKVINDLMNESDSDIKKLSNNLQHFFINVKVRH